MTQRNRDRHSLLSVNWRSFQSYTKPYHQNWTSLVISGVLPIIYPCSALPWSRGIVDVVHSMISDSNFNDHSHNDCEAFLLRIKGKPSYCNIPTPCYTVLWQVLKVLKWVVHSSLLCCYLFSLWLSILFFFIIGVKLTGLTIPLKRIFKGNVRNFLKHKSAQMKDVKISE